MEAIAVRIPYYECVFCTETYDIDDPMVVIDVNSQRELCPNDMKRLQRREATVTVGCVLS